jgi:L-threonylcarbamoyladenylate synthase
MALQTRMIRLSNDEPQAALLAEIAAILRSDGIMAFPTDTFYGLGAGAFSPAAVEKIYALKSRDRGKPLSVVVAGEGQARSLISEIPPEWDPLTREFWPGPLTLVLKARPVFPPEMLGPGGTIAMRVPALPWLCALLRSLEFPVTATSANLSGDGEMDDFAAVDRIFENRVELIIDGGKTPGGAPSTIVDLAGGRPRLLRAGAIPWERIRAVLEIPG